VTFNAREESMKEIAALIATRPAFYVAPDQGRVAGFATHVRRRSGAGYARTVDHTIRLASGASGRGHGRAPMAAVKDHACAGGGHPIFAGVSGENPEGQAFHARLGHAQTAILPQVGRKFGRWMDLLLMQQFLT
jgi:phosphinothricin acetyltransferase